MVFENEVNRKALIKNSMSADGLNSKFLNQLSYSLLIYKINNA